MDLRRVAALSGLVAIGIISTREVGRSSFDQLVLRALGVTRVQRIAVSGTRAVIVAVGGDVLAGLGALAASPLFPLGLARRAAASRATRRWATRS